MLPAYHSAPEDTHTASAPIPTESTNWKPRGPHQGMVSALWRAPATAPRVSSVTLSPKSPPTRHYHQLGDGSELVADAKVDVMEQDLSLQDIVGIRV